MNNMKKKTRAEFVKDFNDVVSAVIKDAQSFFCRKPYTKQIKTYNRAKSKQVAFIAKYAPPKKTITISLAKK